MVLKVGAMLFGAIITGGKGFKHDELLVLLEALFLCVVKQQDKDCCTLS